MCFLFSFGPLHLPLTHTWGQFGFQPQVNTKSASPTQSWCSCQLGSLTSNDPQAMDKHIANYDLHNDVVPQSLLVLFHFPNLAACSFAVNLLHTFGERGFKFPSSDGRLWCRPSLHPHLLFLCCHLLQVSVNVKLVVIFGWQWYKLVGDSRESRICFQKLDKKHFSEFGRQDGKLDKQHELVILIWVLNCLTSQITSFPIIFFILSVFSITIIPDFQVLETTVLLVRQSSARKASQ